MMPNTDKYRYFFFDFDGVIVDSLGIKAEAFGSLFEEYGREVVDKVIDYHLTNGGVSRYEKFKYYYTNLIHEEITPEIMGELDRLYSSKVVEKVVAAAEIDGVVDFIRRRNDEGKLCFVVSATPQEEIRRITRLKGIDRIFKEVVGSPRKKSENLGYILEKYSIERGEAVFFGDAKSDYEAALENGVDFIGVVDEKNRELALIDGITRIRDFRHFGAQ